MLEALGTPYPFTPQNPQVSFKEGLASRLLKKNAIYNLVEYSEYLWCINEKADLYFRNSNNYKTKEIWYYLIRV